MCAWAEHCSQSTVTCMTRIIFVVGIVSKETGAASVGN